MADKKEYIPLEVYGNGRALLFDKGNEEPYFVVFGYDEEANNWGIGVRYKDLAKAVSFADPRNINAARISWSEEDVENVWIDLLVEEGVPLDEAKESLSSEVYANFHKEALTSLENGVRDACIELAYNTMREDATDLVEEFVADREPEQSR